MPRNGNRRTSAALAVLVVAAALAVVGVAPGTSAVADPTAAGRPWERYLLAPDSRTVRAKAVHGTEGTVDNPSGAFGAGAARLTGSGALVTLDFGVNIAGTVSVDFGAVTGTEPSLGLAFAETAKYVGRESEASTGGPRGRDGTVVVPATANGTWTAPPTLLRGAFRYLTVFLRTDGAVELDDVVVHYSAAPLMANPRAYPNHFYSSDDLLNKIWYAGAYTTQLTTIDPRTGRVWPAAPQLWDNTAVTGVGTSILVDGAKRDRTVWPGDLGISLGTAYVSTGDTVSGGNSILTAYRAQKDTGELPYAGPQLSFYRSDTYHLWTLIATAEQVGHTGDQRWLASVWQGYRAGLDYILAKMGPRGLLHVTESNDTTHESRIPDGEEAMANVLLWRTLTTGARLATMMRDPALAADLNRRATSLATAIDQLLWDDTAGAYRWYPERGDIHPQGGNALAVWWGLVSGERAQRVTAHLRQNWVPLGARTPERDNDIQLLFGSFEVQAQLAAGDAVSEQSAVDLMKRSWGHMLTQPQGPQSTFWESLRETGEIVSSYQSYAHGWSTGPTRALTQFVLGLDVTGAGGGEWAFDPRTADLTFAQGRLVTTRGPLDAAWQRDTDRGVMTMTLSAPRGTSGRVGIPTFGERVRVSVNGRPVWTGDGRGGGHATGGHGAHLVGDRLYLEHVPGGDYRITVTRIGR